MDNNLKNSFVYRGTDGKAKLRTWVIAVLVILGLLAILGVYSWYASNLRQAATQATPRPLTDVEATAPTPALPTNSITTSTPANCPSDSSDWSFVDIPDSSNFKRIDPPCVYQGLNKPLAWMLAAHGAGYSNQDAINKLAFTELPFDNHQSAMDFLPNIGDKPVTMKMAWFPLHKDFQEWYVVGQAVVSDVVVVNGCYRTYNLVGNGSKMYWSAQYQSSSYTAICDVAEDRPNGWIVSALDGNVYSTSVSSRRILAEFAYDNRPEYHSWYFLGYSNYMPMSADQLSATETGLQQELNSPLWNLAWLNQVHGLSAQMLPPNWQNDTSQADADRIAKLLGQ